MTETTLVAFISVDDDEEWHPWPPGGAAVPGGAQERPHWGGATDARVSTVYVPGRRHQIVSHRL